MGLYFEIVSAQGVASRVALRPGPQRITAAIGDRYRIVDSDTGKTPPDIVVKRLDSHLLVEGLPDGVKLEIGEFYARCGVSSPCTLVVDSSGSLGGAPVDISPSSPPLQALTDGSFVLYPSGYRGGEAIAVADSESGWGGNATWAIAGVAAAVVAGAAGGGGGGGGASPPVAVSPSPQPSPPPAAPPVETPPADTTPPPQPVITIGDRVTTKTPVIGGTAEAGATVQLAVDVDRDGTSEAMFRTVADPTGNWRIDLASEQPASGALPGGLPDNTTTRLTVTAIDAGQNQSPPATLELQVDASGPAAPRITTVIDDVPARTGNVADGGRTNDRTPTVVGRLGEPLEAGGRIEVFRNGTAIAADVRISGDEFRFTDAGLAFGNSYVYSARVVDAAGNNGETSAGYRIVVQAATTTVATVTAVTDDVPARTGTIASGGLTNDPTPTVSGTLSAPLVAGESLQVLRNGSVIAAGVSVDGTGWRFTDARLGDGSYRYAVRVVDAEGNGPTSAAYAITVDTVNNKTATITAITDNVTPTTGTIRDGGTTNDSSPTLTGRLSQALTAGEELQVLRNDVVLTRAPQVNGTSWTFTDSGLTNGDYDYEVRVVDAAGNLGRLSATYDIRVALTGVRTAEAEPLTLAALTGGETIDPGPDPVFVASATPEAALAVPPPAAWSPLPDEPGA